VYKYIYTYPITVDGGAVGTAKGFKSF